MLQTLKLNSEKRKNFAFPKKKSLVWSTPGMQLTNILEGGHTLTQPSFLTIISTVQLISIYRRTMTYVVFLYAISRILNLELAFLLVCVFILGLFCIQKLNICEPYFSGIYLLYIMREGKLYCSIFNYKLSHHFLNVIAEFSTAWTVSFLKAFYSLLWTEYNGFFNFIK